MFLQYFKLADALRKYLLTQTLSPAGQSTPDAPGLTFSLPLNLLLLLLVVVVVVV